MTSETNSAVVIVIQDEQYFGVAEFNPFDVCKDEEIIDRISSHVVDADETFKCFPVFLVVKSILEHSCQILDEEIGQGKKQAKEMTRVPANTKFNMPLLVLQQIAAELISCKNQIEPEVSHSTTVRILEKLQEYSWEAKAVLVLLAFSMEFMDFSRPLSQFRQISADQDCQSLAILQNMLVLTKSCSDVQKIRQQVHSKLKIFNDCIKTALQVMEMIIKLEKLSSVYDKQGHSSSASQNALVVNSYWVIMAIVACATQMTTLRSDEDNKLQDQLGHYTGKLHNILDSVAKKLNALNAEARLYWELVEIFTAPTDITEALLALLKPLYTQIRDTVGNKWVGVDPVMKGKVALIFISSVNISDEEISLMKETQKRIDEDQHSKFRILWVPFAELNLQTDANAIALLNEKRSKMTWYDLAVHPDRPATIRYIKEEWNYNGEMMLLIMNEHGIIDSPSAAFDLLRHWGMEAFPFDTEAERRISKKFNWPMTVVSKIKVCDSITQKMVSEANEWIKDDKRYIFFFGGRDKAWTEKFQETVKSIEQHLNTSKETKISWFCVGKTPDKRDKDKEDNVSSQFWSEVKKRFLETEDNKKFETKTKQIQALLSYKYQVGWVLLCRGPRAVMSGHGETVLKALEEFKCNWEKDCLNIIQKNRTFEKVFKECYAKIIKENGAGCCQLQIQGYYGKPIKEMKCAECSTTMKVNIVYECCHEGTPVAARR